MLLACSFLFPMDAEARKKKKSRVRLIGRAELCDHPQWQPGGPLLACILPGIGGGRRGLSLRTAIGTEVVYVPVDVTSFNWSDDGGRIVGRYEKRVEEGLFTIQADGSGFQRLRHPPLVVDGYLGFGDQPGKLWYQKLTGREMQSYLYATDLLGGDIQNLEIRGSLFSRSTRGTLAFLRTTYKEGSSFFAIWLRTKEGVERVVPYDFMPETYGTIFHWSPDGRWLAIKGTLFIEKKTKKRKRRKKKYGKKMFKRTRKRLGVRRETWLYVLDSLQEEATFKKLVEVATPSAGLAWAPDSRRLAVQTYRVDPYAKKAMAPEDIRLMEVSVPRGKSKELMSAGRGCAFWTPAWSENGIAVAHDCSKKKKKKKKVRRKLRIYELRKKR